MADQVRSDHPAALEGADPVIRGYVRRAWPRLGPQHRPQLQTRLNRHRTDGDAGHERRAWAAADSAVRVLAPLAIELAGIQSPGTGWSRLPDPAAMLRNLPDVDAYQVRLASDTTRVALAFCMDEFGARRRDQMVTLARAAGSAALAVKAARDAVVMASEASWAELSSPTGDDEASLALREAAGDMAGEAWGHAYAIAAAHIVPWGTDAVEQVAGAGFELLDRLISA